MDHDPEILDAVCAALRSVRDREAGDPRRRGGLAGLSGSIGPGRMAAVTERRLFALDMAGAYFVRSFGGPGALSWQDRIARRPVGGIRYRLPRAGNGCAAEVFACLSSVWTYLDRSAGEPGPVGVESVLEIAGEQIAGALGARNDARRPCAFLPGSDSIPVARAAEQGWNLGALHSNDGSSPFGSLLDLLGSGRADFMLDAPGLYAHTVLETGAGDVAAALGLDGSPGSPEVRAAVEAYACGYLEAARAAPPYEFVSPGGYLPGQRASTGSGQRIVTAGGATAYGDPVVQPRGQETGPARPLPRRAVLGPLVHVYGSPGDAYFAVTDFETGTGSRVLPGDILHVPSRGIAEVYTGTGSRPFSPPGRETVMFGESSRIAAQLAGPDAPRLPSDGRAGPETAGFPRYPELAWPVPPSAGRDGRLPGPGQSLNASHRGRR